MKHSNWQIKCQLASRLGLAGDLDWNSEIKNHADIAIKFTINFRRNLHLTDSVKCGILPLVEQKAFTA